MKKMYILLFFFLYPTLATAQTLTFRDIQRIAQRFEVPVAGLIGILATEKGEAGKARQNKNGSWDMGPFQINTCHVNEIIKLGYSPQEILMSPRLNAVFAARLLRKHYLRENDIWRAIGAYHSRTPALQRAYILRVQSRLTDLDIEQLFFNINNKELQDERK